MKDQKRLREDTKNKVGIWGKSHLGGHDMVRRVRRNGETSIWCRKCSGYARQRLGHKLMHEWKLEKMDTKEYGKMLKRIFNP